MAAFFSLILPSLLSSPFTATSVLILTALLASPQHVAAQTTNTSHEGCIHLPVIHSTNRNYFSKRAVETDLANRSDVAYYMELNLGTPPQAQFVQIDTGSFELWVNPDCSTESGADAAFCRGVGNFDTSKSSTLSSLGNGTTLRYGIGSANVSYVVDDVGIASGGTTASTNGGASNNSTSLAVLRQIQFGVASSSTDEFSGVLGIGYGLGLATAYPNFIDQLAMQNITKVKAFSLALGSKQAEAGSVVFGGIDRGKFGGPLARLPIVPAADSPDGVPRYWVRMEELALNPPARNGSASAAAPARSYAGSDIPAFLDSGSTMTLLPPDLTASIAADFGAADPTSTGLHQVDCSLTRLNGSLDFAFSGVTVQVPYDELIRTVAGNPPTCYLGIQSSKTFTLLGDTFMRSAYAVFDLESNSIWMAQAHNCDSLPEAVTSVQNLASANGTCYSDQIIARPALASSATSGTTTTTTTTAGRATITRSGAIATDVAASSAATASAATAKAESGARRRGPAVGSRSSSTAVAAVVGWSLVVAALGSVLT